MQLPHIIIKLTNESEATRRTAKKQELKKQQEQENQNKQKEATPQQKTNQASEQNGTCNICHFTYKLAENFNKKHKVNKR
ncbi:hypothetical protein [Bacillus proteolyticus]|uniref:hypothetical protein n=1 Tax=Bacillus proteolyticus TaxID=2026192 RepID=UPI0030F3C19B